MLHTQMYILGVEVDPGMVTDTGENPEERVKLKVMGREQCDIHVHSILESTYV